MPPVSSVAVYYRVSSKAQNYEMQRDAIARALPPGTEPEVFKERQSSRTNDRPELLRLMAAVRAGQVKTLYCFKLDRLCRTGVADTFKVVHELRQAGVTMMAVADNLTIRPDSQDIASECLIFALGLAARLERTAINDRIAAARMRMEAAGEPWGRPPKVTPQQAETARRMRQGGSTVRQIAQALGVPRSTIGRALV